MEEKIKINKKFEIILPNIIRKTLNITPGDIIILEHIKDNNIHIYKK